MTDGSPRDVIAQGLDRCKFRLSNFAGYRERTVLIFPEICERAEPLMPHGVAPRTPAVSKGVHRHGML
jgi:hypothetical protein